MTTKTAAQELREIAELLRRNSQNWIVPDLLSLADRIERDHEDAERFRALPFFDRVSFRLDSFCISASGEYHTAWFKGYVGMPDEAPFFDGDKLAALRAAVDAARGK